MSAPKLPAPLEALVMAALGPLEKGNTYSLHNFAAVAQALNEVGISARAMWTDVAFDPEWWQRPIGIEALKVKSAITDGLGNYGWDAVIEEQRKRQEVPLPDDYCDRQGTHSVNWEGLLALQTDEEHRKNLLTKLSLARAVLQQWKIDQDTPSAAPTTRRPGL